MPRRRSASSLPESLSAGLVDSLDPVGAAAIPTRFRVGLATGESFILSADAVLALRIKKGVQLTEADCDAVLKAARATWLFDKATALLALRGRTVRDLAIRLRRLGATAGESALVTERLQEMGLLSDERFAEAFAASKGTSGVARRKITQELRRRGVGSVLADRATRAALGDDEAGELEAAQELAERRLKSLAKLDAPVARRRLFGFLVRRGYSSGVAGKICKRLLP